MEGESALAATKMLNPLKWGFLRPIKPFSFMPKRTLLRLRGPDTYRDLQGKVEHIGR